MMDADGNRRTHERFACGGERSHAMLPTKPINAMIEDVFATRFTCKRYDPDRNRLGRRPEHHSGGRSPLPKLFRA